jgi:hypothetical protein
LQLLLNPGPFQFSEIHLDLPIFDQILFSYFERPSGDTDGRHFCYQLDFTLLNGLP